MRAATMFIAIGLTGCAAPIVTETASTIVQPLPIIETKWSMGIGVNVCDKPADPSPSKCPSIKHGVPVSILEKRKDYLGRDVYVVESDGHKGFISDYEYKYRLLDEDPKVTASRAKQKAAAEKSDCDRRGGVRVGMTKAQVLASCWGKDI